MPLSRGLKANGTKTYAKVYLKCSLDLCVEREKTRIESHSAPEDIYERGRKAGPYPELMPRMMSLKIRNS